MYKDVGKKIMRLAQVLGWVELIAGIVVFFQSFPVRYNGPEVYGWICLAAGVVGFIASWALYAFGQLVHDVHEMKNQSVKTEEISNDELPTL